MRILSTKVWAPVLLALFALCLPVAQAQTQPQQSASSSQPLPPLSPVASSSDGQSGSSNQKSDQEPASPILTGPQVITGAFPQRAGASAEAVSRLLAGFNVSEVYTTNVFNATLNPVPDEVTNVGGYFDYERARQTTDLNIRYAGQGSFYAQNPSLNNTTQDFEVSDILQFRRWKLRVDDLFSYLTQSSFGFVNGAPAPPVNNQGGGAAGGQTIFLPYVRRYTNSLLGQADVNLSPRSALSFTGNYLNLHYLDPGFVDTLLTDLTAGYNYSLTSKNTVGVQYDFTAIRYNPVVASINTNTILFMYGYNLNPQLNLTVGVGPEFASYTPQGATAATNFTVLNATARMDYVFKTSGMTVAFYRGVGGGSGIIAGTVSNVVQLSGWHQFNRNWTVNAAGGSALNTSLPQVAGINNLYISSYLVAGVTRQLGRRASFYVNYEVLRQTTGTANVCGLGVLCPGRFITNQVWIGFSYNMRPIGFMN